MKYSKDARNNEIKFYHLISEKIESLEELLHDNRIIDNVIEYANIAIESRALKTALLALECRLQNMGCVKAENGNFYAIVDIDEDED